MHRFWCLFFTAGNWEKDTENGAPGNLFRHFYFETASEIFWWEFIRFFGPIVLSHKSSSEMSASGYVTLLIRSVESSPSLIASYHLAFKRVLKNNNFFKNHFLISNLILVEELSAWVVQNYVNFDMKTLGFAKINFLLKDDKKTNINACIMSFWQAVEYWNWCWKLNNFFLLLW